MELRISSKSLTANFDMGWKWLKILFLKCLKMFAADPWEFKHLASLAANSKENILRKFNPLPPFKARRREVSFFYMKKNYQWFIISLTKVINN